MRVYKYMAEVADRRTKKYKDLEFMLDCLVNKHGKESKEVNEFFDKEVVDVIGYEI